MRSCACFCFSLVIAEQGEKEKKEKKAWLKPHPSQLLLPKAIRLGGGSALLDGGKRAPAAGPDKLVFVLAILEA
jgi:hypothetical protein